MAQLSPEQFHLVNAGLSADVRLPPPKDLAEVPEPLLNDGLLKRGLEENAALKKNAALEEEQLSLERKLDASRKENKSRGQKLTAARKEKKLLVVKLDASERENEALRQKLDASVKRENEALRQKPSASQNVNCQEYKSLGQKLSASQRDLDMRLLLTEFRQKDMGRALDIGLLEKEKKDDNPLPERLAKIVIIDKKLACLKAASISFQKPEIKWDGNQIGEDFYSWCLHVADVNKACHRGVTKELLDGMSKLAARGEYTYGEVKLGPVVQAAIRDMRLRMVSTSASTGTGRPR